jgi:hypothetical protein
VPSHNGHCEVALRNGVETLGEEREREEDIIVEVGEGMWKVE